MERLKLIADEKGLSVFDVEDVVALLAHKRTGGVRRRTGHPSLSISHLDSFSRYERSECRQMGGIDSGGKVS